jgi:hypothetical protein
MLDIFDLLIRIWMRHRNPEPIGPEPWRPL